MRRIPSWLMLGTLAMLLLGCPSEEDAVGVSRPSSATPKPTPTTNSPTGSNVGGTIHEAGLSTPPPGAATPTPSPTPTQRVLLEPAGPSTPPSPTPTPSIDPTAW